jgi:pimeloyl-ACP methyl ester carboxylesterase
MLDWSSSKPVSGACSHRSSILAHKSLLVHYASKVGRNAERPRILTEAFGNQMPPPEMMQAWLMTWYGIRMQALHGHVAGEVLKGAFGEGMLGQQDVHTELVEARKCPRLAVYMTKENVENEKGLDVGAGDEVVLVGDAGHWLQHIKAGEFNRILTKWLIDIEDKQG